jgi:hypothetical protein
VVANVTKGLVALGVALLSGGCGSTAPVPLASRVGFLRQVVLAHPLDEPELAVRLQQLDAAVAPGGGLARWVSHAGAAAAAGGARLELRSGGSAVVVTRNWRRTVDDGTPLRSSLTLVVPLVGSPFLYAEEHSGLTSRLFAIERGDLFEDPQLTSDAALDARGADSDGCTVCKATVALVVDVGCRVAAPLTAYALCGLLGVESAGLVCAIAIGAAGSICGDPNIVPTSDAEKTVSCNLIADAMNRQAFCAPEATKPAASDAPSSPPPPSPASGSGL